MTQPSPIYALLWKEWREQRWRIALGALVLTTLSGSLVRAQLLPLREALIPIFSGLALLLTSFFAMGSVATERQDRTWHYLLARPIARPTILRVKWLVGAGGLLGCLLLAALAAHLAAGSRGIFDFQPMSQPQYTQSGALHSQPLSTGSAAYLWWTLTRAAFAMLGWYTVLFFILARARDELHAGLGGLIISVGALCWLAQHAVLHFWPTGWPVLLREALRVVAYLNPLTPLYFYDEGPTPVVLLSMAVCSAWVVAGVWLLPGRRETLGEKIA